LFKLPVADAAKMAQAGYRGMQQGRRLVIPGLTNNVLALLSRVAPRRPLLWVSAKTIQPKGG
jgi:short-subunit dehydrogenase